MVCISSDTLRHTNLHTVLKERRHIDAVDVRRLDHTAHGVYRVGHALSFRQCYQPRFFHLSGHIHGNGARCLCLCKRPLVQCNCIPLQVIAIQGAAEHRKCEDKENHDGFFEHRHRTISLKIYH